MVLSIILFRYKDRDILVTGEDNSKERREGIRITNTSGDISNVGDTGRKIIDTGDIDRASIAKGIRGPDEE
jgi:hypothetical protein